MQKTIADEGLRIEMLLDAQNKAAQLFAEIERSGMIRAGLTEKELSDERGTSRFVVRVNFCNLARRATICV